MHSDEPRIVGLGIACLDHVFVTSQTRGAGQGELLSHVTEGGGLVATALAAAARLGARAQIITWVGDDEAGSAVLKGLQDEGIDVSLAAVVPGGETAVSFVQVEADTGERTIYHKRGVEAEATQAKEALRLLQQADVALVDGVWPRASLPFSRRMKELGIPVVGDFCPDPARRELAWLADALIVSQECSQRLFPEGSWETRLRGLAAKGPTFVGITAGEEGCYWLSDGEPHHHQAFHVEVVDTTGAGDVFHGAFAYGLAREWGYERCVEFASAAAALSCRVLGGRKGMPTLREVERMMARGASEQQA